MNFKVEAIVADLYKDNGQLIEVKHRKYYTKQYNITSKDRSDALIAAGNRVSAESLVHQGLEIVG